MSSAGNPGFAGGWEGYSLIATALILFLSLHAEAVEQVPP